MYDTLLCLGETALPLFDDFANTPTTDIAARLLVVPRGLESAVGFVELTDLSQAGHVQAAIHVTPGQQPGVAADAAALVVNYAFCMWRVAKVYLRTGRTDLDHLGLSPAGVSLLDKEATLANHLFYQGRLWDEHVYSISRAAWDVRGKVLVDEIS